jgi:beta-glucanase (GH16 family)
VPVPLGVAGSWSLSFRDEFDGSSVDANKWFLLGSAQDPGNVADGFGDQIWRPQNVAVSGSQLIITVDNAAGQAFGGGICSEGKWQPGCGYLESRIKMPGAGGWPAWWLQSHNNGNTLTPSVDGTEMDIAEGSPFGAGPTTIEHHVHWNGYGANHQVVDQACGVSDGDWHVYGLNWQTGFYKFYVDGVLKLNFTTAIANPALGAIEYMLFDNASWTGGADSGVMYVDYVRYWTGS